MDLRKCLILCFALFFHWKGISQAVNFIYDDLEKYGCENVDSVQKYLKYVQLGELLITKGEYQASYDFYRKAFVEKWPFLVDLNNHKALCIKLNKLEEAELVSKKIDFCLTKSRDNLLWVLLKEDQEDRDFVSEKQEFIYNGEGGKYIRYRDSLRYERFERFVSSNGLPRECDIGVTHINGTMPLPVSVLFSHWQSWGFDIKKYTLRGVMNGVFKPYDAFSLDDSYSKNLGIVISVVKD